MEKMPSDHCNHFVIRKKRYCRMSIRPGEKYCGEHTPAQNINDTETKSDEKIRVVCPLDRKHTCYAHNLKKHLKICNARAGVTLPYIQKGVNSGKEDDKGDLDCHKLLSLYTTDEIGETIKKINSIFEEHLVDRITPNFTSHQLVEEEISKPEHGDKSKKHLKQASAILGILVQLDLIKPKTCYIEFGAGRGQLSYWIAQANNSESVFLLVERSSPKHKRDNKLDKTDDKVKRIRADIADLVLDKIEGVEKTSSIVGVTKHLCGDATDLALRCLANVQDHTNVAGCVMTFCCHHRCRWTAYTGKEFFKSVDLTKTDFDIMCSMSSWATCGTGFSREKNSKIGSNEAEKLQNDRDKAIGLTRLQKGEIGKKSKTIINWGRVKYLEDLGFKANLHYYVGSEISLENVCVVAHKNGIKNDKNCKIVSFVTF